MSGEKRMSVVAEDDRASAREDFVRAMTWRMEERGLSLRELATQLGRATHTAFYRWIEGKAEPLPQEVFAIERLLEMPPGALSRYLGYLPPEARAQTVTKITIDDWLKQDPELTDVARRMFRAMYVEATRTKPTKKR